MSTCASVNSATNTVKPSFKMHDARFSVSAPGKVILFGEHSVVYGYPAIAVAVNLRCHFDCSLNNRIGCDSHEGGTVKFVLKDLDNFCCSIAIPESEAYLNATCAQLRDRSMDFSRNLVEQTSPALSLIAPLTDSVAVLTYLLLRSIQFYHAAPYQNISYLHNSDVEISVLVHSEIPMGSGLGSSAAFAVAAATLFQILVGNFPVDKFVPNKEQCDRIRHLAHEAEVIVHGTPSGVDTSISTDGGAVYFKRNVDGSPLIQPLHTSSMHHFTLLIVDSKVDRSTKTIVTTVAENHKRNPDEVDRIFESIGQLTEQAHRLFNGIDTTDTMGVLNDLVDRNQKLLHALGVSSTTLDHIIQLLHDIGLSSKLTGAGIGGCVIGLNRTGDPKVLKRAKEKMCQIGFPAKTVDTFVQGVHSLPIHH